MKRFIVTLLVLTVAVGLAAARGEAERPAHPGDLEFWTQEGEADGGFQYVRSLVERFMEQNEEIRIVLGDKGTEDLREDFQNAAIAGNPPQLLWTVNDHAGPFTAAGIIRPVDDIYNADEFIQSVVMDGKTWGVPISAGNHLMLMYNRTMISEPPQTTDELIELAIEHTRDGRYGLVYDSTEPFWLVPWLGGFGGRVFADDGVTPTLNTPEMRAALEFLAELQFEHEIVPIESDYTTADSLFKEGKAAMIINGDWTLSVYRRLLGDDLGVAPLPVVSATGLRPAPYTSGKYFMVSREATDEQLETVREFITFVTSEEMQVEMVEELTRLPARLSVMDHPLIADDPLLSGSARQMAYGTPMPSVVQMRAVWDAMKPEMNLVLTGQRDVADAPRRMQEGAVSTIADM